jgi:hypothetical protein
MKNIFFDKHKHVFNNALKKKKASCFLISFGSIEVYIKLVFFYMATALLDYNFD